LEADVSMVASGSPVTVSPAHTTWLHGHAGRILLILGAVAGCAFALWYLVFDKAVTVYPVVRSDLVQSVVATGQVMTPQRTSIAAEVTGRVVRVPVAEGQTVRKGKYWLNWTKSTSLRRLRRRRRRSPKRMPRLRTSDGRRCRSPNRRSLRRGRT
jgi:HlyD family secretion protein